MDFIAFLLSIFDGTRFSGRIRPAWCEKVVEMGQFSENDIRTLRFPASQYPLRLVSSFVAAHDPEVPFSEPPDFARNGTAQIPQLVVPLF